MSSVHKLVCIICLEKFTLNETESGSSNGNVPLVNKLTCGSYEAETINSPNSNAKSAQWNDPYTRFLLFVKGYFKLTTFANRFLTCAKEAKNENGENTKLHTFCDGCGQLVSDICKLYKELQTAQLFLLWKLSLVGELMKKSNGQATDDSTSARNSMAKQMNMIPVKPVDMFRKALLLKCVNGAKKCKSKPIVSIYKGLVPDHWKFTYSATQEALIRLIVLFTLASDQLSLKLSKHNPEVKTKDVKNVAKRRSGRPKKKQIFFQENSTDQIVAISNLDKMVKVEDITAAIADPSVLEGDDDQDQAPDNLENDSDWSRDAATATPMSVGSVSPENHDETQYSTEETYSKTGWNLRGRRNLVVIAEEDEGDADAKSQEFQIGGDGDDDDPVGIVPSVQCFRYTRVASNVQVAMHLIDKDTHEKETEEAEQLKMGNFNQPLESGTKTKLQCPKCPTQFEDGRGLIMHLKSFHNTSVEYPCKTCGMRFKWQRHLRNHHRKMHGPRSTNAISSPCPKCSEVFPSQKELWRHQRKAHKLHRRPGPRPVSSSCPKCSEVFPSRKEFWRHQKKAHEQPWRKHRGGQPVSSSCPKCSEVFPSRTELVLHHQKTHRLLHRGVRPVQSICPKCSEVFPSKQKLLLHLKISHRPKVHILGRPKLNEVEMKGLNEKFICEIDSCGESFELASLLLNHLKTVHEEESSKLKSISCMYCKHRKKFAYRQTYEMHVRTSHKIKIFGMFSCDVESCATTESFLSLDDLNEHLKSHLEEPESGIDEITFCEKCNWGFSRSALRDLHQLCHITPGDDGKFDCPQCSKRYGPNVKLLQNHFNIMHGVNMRPFRCDLCEATFLFERFLDQHKKNHAKLNARSECVCELCGAQFCRQQNLVRHMIRHKEPRFSCDICGALFKFKEKMNEHKKHMHDPDRSKSFICSDCGKSFYSGIGLRFHFDSSHKPESEWALKCPKCPTRFYRNLYLGIHLKTCEGNEEEENRRLEKEVMNTAAASSPQTQQNEFQDDLSSSLISQQPPIVQSNPIQLNENIREIPPELPGMVLPLPPQIPQPESQVYLSEKTHDMITFPENKDGVDDNVKNEVSKDNISLIERDDYDDQMPEQDHIGNDDDSDWSRGGASPRSDACTVSSGNDDDREEANETPPSKTRWNLRGRQVAKTEEDDKDEDSSEIEDLDEDPLFQTKSPSPLKNQTKFKTGQKLKTYSKLRPVVEIKSTEVNLRAPINLIHSDSTTRSTIKLFCPECSKVFRSEFRLEQHMTTVHEKGKPEVEKTIQCWFCSKRYSYQETLRWHLNTNHVRKSGTGFKCDLESCETDAFASIRELNEHLKTHLLPSENISFCGKCNWGFMRRELRDLHELDHISPGKDDRKYACPQCPKTFSGLCDLQNHFNKKHGLNLKRFQCDIDSCEKSFFAEHFLQGHKRWHDKLIKQWSSEDFKCGQCDVSFEDKCGLEAHLNSGHLFHCLEPGCDQKFDTKRKLNIHRTMKHLVDSTEREWICELCAARFTKKETLNRHVQNHDEDRKYSCHICGATFKRKDKLPLHIESKHNPNRVKSWICSLCGKSYHTETGLQYHTDSEHKKESEWHLKCPHCPRRFYRNMYLYRHLKTCKKGDKMDDQSNEPVQSTSSTTTSPMKRKRLRGHQSSVKEIDDYDQEKSLLSVQTEHEEKMEHSTTPDEDQLKHKVLQHGIELSDGGGGASTSTSAIVPNFPQVNLNQQPLNSNPFLQGSQKTPDVYSSPDTLHQSWTSF